MLAFGHKRLLLDVFVLAKPNHRGALRKSCLFWQPTRKCTVVTVHFAKVAFFGNPTEIIIIIIPNYEVATS